uniref:Vinculin n=1 Tax=Oscarella pearsei TaxID=1940113 RepID=VINC_OSCPE|nr:RecName: Full=Vinculin [Oscarella pearsei]AYN71345.1 vinculin [Oscarella pearsei]6BFI_A Chain A, VIN1 [Oscarella pearsei]6BFI_B Chain B, VIN1 [Oscarella pearsei]|eukprot:m.307082 g.307082  ORF g.307082 m.307082 type:complete len:847 (+) comp41876_c0_seq1:174-2714(+)
MPVKFHTKTLESVIDPVAQQVGQLVLFHEQAESGLLKEDLTPLVQGVGIAVTNLVQVAASMVETSNDEDFKAELPPSMQEVQQAAVFLSDAARLLKADQGSPEGKRKLLDGARGVINGMSDLLMCADRSEVRKMVKVCRSVQEYLDVAKVIDVEADLATFLQNLTPGMTSMMKVVEQRHPELTNLAHAQMLKSELGTVREQIPILISSIRVCCLVIVKDGSSGMKDAAFGRDYVIQKLFIAIEEIIRVLQLTTTFEEEEVGGAGAASAASLAHMFHQAQDALASGDISRSTLDAVRKCISEGRRVAALAATDETRAKLLAAADELDQILKELEELQAKGLGDSRQARALAHAAAVKLQELEQEIRKALAERVATDFVNVGGPIKALEDAALASPSDPNRQANFAQKAKEFEAHTARLADTAELVASSGGCSDAVAAELRKEAAKLRDISTAVVPAARVVLENPGNQAAKDYLRTVKEKWLEAAESMGRSVDGVIDSLEFMKVSEARIQADVKEAKRIALAEEDSMKLIAKASSVARQANRVIQVAKVEADNSENPEFVAKLSSASESLAKSISPMVIEAKAVVTSPQNKDIQRKFCSSADKVVEGVAAVRSVIEDNWVPPRPPLPELEEEEEPPELPPPPEDPASLLPAEMQEAEEMLRAPLPPKDQNPIHHAAASVFREADQWDEKGNDLISLVKQMARKMAMMSKYTRGESGEVRSKADLIRMAKEIALNAQELLKLARQIANACMDKRAKTNLLQLLDRIPTISTQLKILATVKATSMGGGDARADADATDMLVGNAENLMRTVKDVIRASEAACIRLRPDSPIASILWRKKGGQGRRISVSY